MFGHGKEDKKKTGIFGSVDGDDKPNSIFGTKPAPNNLFGSGKPSSEGPQAKNLFSSNISKQDTFGTNGDKKSISPLFGSGSGFGAGSQGVSSIGGKKQDSNIFTSQRSGNFGRKDQDMDDDDEPHQSPSKGMRRVEDSRSSSGKINSKINESFIRILSDKRSIFLNKLSAVWNKKNQTVKTKKIDFWMDGSDPQHVEFQKQPNTDKLLTEINFESLQDFRKTIDDHIKMAEENKFGHVSPNDLNLLNEMNVLILVLFSMYFIEQIYVPYCSRNIIRSISDKKKEVDSEYQQSLDKMEVPEKLYQLLLEGEIEQAYECLASAEMSSEILEEVSKILAPIKNYFKSGIHVTYQKYEIIQKFQIMNQNSEELLRTW